MSNDYLAYRKARATQPEELEAAIARLGPSVASMGAAGLLAGPGPVFVGIGASLAAACAMNLAAFRMAVHRLRKRLRQCVKAEVAGTLADPEMVQEEMQALFAALGG